MNKTFSLSFSGSFSGKSLPARPLLASSGFMLIVFFSDTNYVLTGFRAEFFVHACPNNCSEHGICQDQTCQCFENWTGTDCKRLRFLLGFKLTFNSIPGSSCDIRICPDQCGNYTGKGICDFTSKQCSCSPSYSGVDCSLDENNFIGNTWHYLAQAERQQFQKRTGHAIVYASNDNKLFAFGGFDLNSVLDSFQSYDFNHSQWETLNLTNGPTPRYGHSMVMLEDLNSFVIYGGQLEVNGKTKTRNFSAKITQPRSFGFLSASRLRRRWRF